MAAGEAAARQDCLAEDEALRYVSAPPDDQAGPGAAADLALQRHLDACTPCRAMIAEAARAMSESGLAASPGAEATAAASGPWPRPPTSLAVGEVLLDRYTIAAFIARGGMGEVYEAYDDVLKETVALKTLVCTDLDRPAAVQRLMAEVRLARQVTHPNVCRIYEFGMHEPAGRGAGHSEAIPFLTMEFLRGETLDRRLARQGACDPADVVRLLDQMTAGLSAIHAAGIIHRDIKPANLFLLPGPRERLVLMDLGLARSANPVETGMSLSGGGLVGTVDYMAPEQVGGQPVTRAVDIYALGLVIFELLTGKRPFRRTDALSGAVERMTAPAPKPSALVPGLHPAWDRLIARCLAPDPERRFATVEELAAFVHRSIARRPAPTGAWARLRSVPARRARLMMLAGAVALVTLLAVQWGRRQQAGPGAGLGVSALSNPWGPKRPPAFRAQRSFGPNGCSADMVRVADRLCVDRFEASVVDDLEQRPLTPYYPPSSDLTTKVLEDWQRRVEGGTTGLPLPLPELPDWQRQIGWRPRAVSQLAVLPHGYATQIIAAVACSSAGKRLCTTEEWRLACRGQNDTRFPYGDSYQEGVCNVHRTEHPAEMLKIDYTDGLLDPRMNQMVSKTSGPLLRATGATAGCASRWGDDAVYDMVGNLDEWSADGALLGGFFSRQTQDGCDYSNTRHGPEFFNYSLGFRCCDRLR